MATFTKRELSGSTDGRMIKVAATATAGTLIHTATTGNTTSDDYDEIYLWAMNSDTTVRKLTIEFGGVTSPDDLIEVFIEPEAGLVQVVPGLPLNNTVVVRAFCSTANVVMMVGYVNRISP